MAVINILNIEQVVEMLKPLGISRPSIYRAIGSKNLKAVKVGRRYIITELSLNNFLSGENINQ
jgi:excisionase family DNA binding protein